jgi:hypothetical protein
MLQGRRIQLTRYVVKFIWACKFGQFFPQPGRRKNEFQLHFTAEEWGE